MLFFPYEVCFYFLFLLTLYLVEILSNVSLCVCVCVGKRTCKGTCSEWVYYNIISEKCECMQSNTFTKMQMHYCHHNLKQAWQIIHKTFELGFDWPFLWSVHWKLNCVEASAGKMHCAVLMPAFFYFFFFLTGYEYSGRVTYLSHDTMKLKHR